MIHSRIRPTTLRDRLDASYYSPDVLANEAALLARGATELRHLIDVARSNYGILPPSEDYLPVGSGVPLIRGGDLDNGDIRDPEVHAPLEFRNERGTAAVGDVLLLIKGACIDSPAGIALVAERHAGSVFNGSCYRIKPLPVCDGGYLVAFCQTTHLLLQKRREIANTGIAYNAEASILGYLVPRLALEGQRYIGDKVRQAERLRARARALRDSVQASFLAAGFVAVPEPVQKVGRVRWQGLVDRLDALHYRADLLKNLERIRHHRTVSLGSKKDFGELGDGDHGNPVYGSGPIYVRATELSGGLLDGATDVRLDEAYTARLPASVWSTAEDVMFSIVATLGAVGIVEDGTRAVMSRGVAKVRPLSLPKHYVKAFMRTPTFGLELLRRSVGTIQRGVYLESLQGLEIPLLPSPDIESIARAEADSDACVAAARGVASAARLLVQGLIEGNLTETQLVAAQRALEVGDRSADRGLLSDLRRGAGANAPALLPDIDALYALLDDEDLPGGGD